MKKTVTTKLLCLLLALAMMVTVMAPVILAADEAPPVIEEQDITPDFAAVGQEEFLAWLLDEDGNLIQANLELFNQWVVDHTDDSAMAEQIALLVNSKNESQKIEDPEQTEETLPAEPEEEDESDDQPQLPDFETISGEDFKDWLLNGGEQPDEERYNQFSAWVNESEDEETLEAREARAAVLMSYVYEPVALVEPVSTESVATYINSFTRASSLTNVLRNGLNKEGAPAEKFSGHGSYMLNYGENDKRMYAMYVTDGDSQGGVSETMYVYVYMNQGEMAYFGTSVVNSTLGDDHKVKTNANQQYDIVVDAPSLKAKYKYNISANSTTAAGRINNRAQEKAGPKIGNGGLVNTAGYNPLYFEATEKGVYTFHFHSQNGNYKAPGETTNRDAWSDTSSTVAAWDVTVMGWKEHSADTQTVEPKAGRLWMNHLFIHNGLMTGCSPELYVLAKDGFQYKVNFDSFHPIGFVFFSNNMGFTTLGEKSGNTVVSPKKSIYHSFYTENDDVTNIQDKNYVDFHNPGAQDDEDGRTDGAKEITHRLFLEKPNPDLKGVTDQTRTGSTQKEIKLLEDTREMTPTPVTPTNKIVPLTFEASGSTSAGNRGIITYGHGGIFKYKVGDETTAILTLNFSTRINQIKDSETPEQGEAYYSATQYLANHGSSIVKLTTTDIRTEGDGENWAYFHWDGKDTKGVYLPVGTYEREYASDGTKESEGTKAKIDVVIEARSGEIHFPMFDPEGLGNNNGGGGLTIKRVTSIATKNSPTEEPVIEDDEAPARYNLFFNHSPLVNGTIENIASKAVLKNSYYNLSDGTRSYNITEKKGGSGRSTYYYGGPTYFPASIGQYTTLNKDKSETVGEHVAVNSSASEHPMRFNYDAAHYTGGGNWAGLDTWTYYTTNSSSSLTCGLSVDLTIMVHSVNEGELDGYVFYDGSLDGKYSAPKPTGSEARRPESGTKDTPIAGQKVRLLVKKQFGSDSAALNDFVPFTVTETVPKYDERGSFVYDVHGDIVYETKEVMQETVTDENGHYLFTNIPVPSKEDDSVTYGVQVILSVADTDIKDYICTTSKIATANVNQVENIYNPDFKNDQQANYVNVFGAGALHNAHKNTAPGKTINAVGSNIFEEVRGLDGKYWGGAPEWSDPVKNVVNTYSTAIDKDTAVSAADSTHGPYGAGGDGNTIDPLHRSPEGFRAWNYRRITTESMTAIMNWLTAHTDQADVEKMKAIISQNYKVGDLLPGVPYWYSNKAGSPLFGHEQTVTNVQTVALSKDHNKHTFGDIGYISGVPYENQKNYSVVKDWGTSFFQTDELIYELWCWNDPGKSTGFDQETHNGVGDNPRSGNLVGEIVLKKDSCKEGDGHTDHDANCCKDTKWCKHELTYTWENLDNRVQYYLVESYYQRDSQGALVYNDRGELHKVLIGTTMPVYAPLKDGTTGGTHVTLESAGDNKLITSKAGNSDVTSGLEKISKIDYKKYAENAQDFELFTQISTDPEKYGPGKDYPAYLTNHNKAGYTTGSSSDGKTYTANGLATKGATPGIPGTSTTVAKKAMDEKGYYHLFWDYEEYIDGSVTYEFHDPSKPADDKTNDVNMYKIPAQWFGDGEVHHDGSNYGEKDTNIDTTALLYDLTYQLEIDRKEGATGVTHADVVGYTFRLSNEQTLDERTYYVWLGHRTILPNFATISKYVPVEPTNLIPNPNPYRKESDPEKIPERERVYTSENLKPDKEFSTAENDPKYFSYYKGHEGNSATESVNENDANGDWFSVAGIRISSINNHMNDATDAFRLKKVGSAIDSNLKRTQKNRAGTADETVTSDVYFTATSINNYQESGTGARSYLVEYFTYKEGVEGHNAGDPVPLEKDTNGKYTTPEGYKPGDPTSSVNLQYWTMTIYVYDVEHEKSFTYDPYSTTPIQLTRSVDTTVNVTWLTDPNSKEYYPAKAGDTPVAMDNHREQFYKNSRVEIDHIAANDYYRVPLPEGVVGDKYLNTCADIVGVAYSPEGLYAPRDTEGNVIGFNDSSYTEVVYGLPIEHSAGKPGYTVTINADADDLPQNYTDYNSFTGIVHNSVTGYANNALNLTYWDNNKNNYPAIVEDSGRGNRKVPSTRMRNYYATNYTVLPDNAIDYVGLGDDGMAYAAGQGGGLVMYNTIKRTNTSLSKGKDHANYIDLYFYPNASRLDNPTIVNTPDVFYYKTVVFGEGFTGKNLDYSQMDATMGVVMVTSLVAIPEQVKPAAATLTISDAINVNFYFSGITDETSSQFYVQFCDAMGNSLMKQSDLGTVKMTFSGKNMEGGNAGTRSNEFLVQGFGANNLTTLAEDNKTKLYGFTYQNANAYEMGGTIYARVFRQKPDGELYYVGKKGYSIQWYAENMMYAEKNETDEHTKLFTMLKDMLNYGAAAQEYAAEQNWVVKLPTEVEGQVGANGIANENATNGFKPLTKLSVYPDTVPDGSLIGQQVPHALANYQLDKVTGIQTAQTVDVNKANNEKYAVKNNGFPATKIGLTMTNGMRMKLTATIALTENEYNTALTFETPVNEAEICELTHDRYDNLSKPTITCKCGREIVSDPTLADDYDYQANKEGNIVPHVANYTVNRLDGRDDYRFGFTISAESINNLRDMILACDADGSTSEHVNEISFIIDGVPPFFWQYKYRLSFANATLDYGVLSYCHNKVQQVTTSAQEAEPSVDSEVIFDEETVTEKLKNLCYAMACYGESAHNWYMSDETTRDENYYGNPKAPEQPTADSSESVPGDTEPTA